MIRAYSILGSIALLGMTSCGLKQDEPLDERRAPLTFSERLNERNGYKQDASGNWVPLNDKRSSFESQGRSPYFSGTQDKKAFDAASYDKKRYEREGYATKSFYHGKDGNRFSKPSSLSQTAARESAQSHQGISAYQTKPIDRTSASESGRDSIDKPTDYQTEKRRDVYIPPEVIDYKQQREMTVDESKGILGRLRGD